MSITFPQRRFIVNEGKRLIDPLNPWREKTRFSKC
jgi:hypothetical protein